MFLLLLIQNYPFALRKIINKLVLFHFYKQGRQRAKKRCRFNFTLGRLKQTGARKTFQAKFWFRKKFMLLIVARFESFLIRFLHHFGIDC